MERYNKQEHPKINILTFTSYIYTEDDVSV